MNNILNAESPSILDLNGGTTNGNTLLFCDENTTFFDSTTVPLFDNCP